MQGDSKAVFQEICALLEAHNPNGIEISGDTDLNVDLNIEVHQVDELLENLRGFLGFAVPGELRRIFLG